MSARRPFLRPRWKHATMLIALGASSSEPTVNPDPLDASTKHRSTPVFDTSNNDPDRQSILEDVPFLLDDVTEPEDSTPTPPPPPPTPPPPPPPPVDPTDPCRVGTDCLDCALRTPCG